jgi:FtsP/CotA-like multicopper oxidase with cupredoxin domain
MGTRKPTPNGLDSVSKEDGQIAPTISRRGFLIAGASFATVAALPIPALAGGYRDRSRDGLLDTQLRVLRAKNLIPQWEVVTSIYKGKVHFTKKLVNVFVVDTRTYEGTIPGPVLHVQRGDVLKIKHNNEIPADSDPTGLPMIDVNIPHGFNITNLHTHGFNVPPTTDPPLEALGPDELPEKSSDNVLFAIPPGKAVQYQYEIPDNHADGTFWYHPHKHGSVAFQMMGGMGGVIVIEGPTDRLLRRKGVNKDKVFAIQQVRPRIDPDTNQREVTIQLENFTDVLVPPLYTVNGKLNPVIYIRPGEVERWRFVHAGMSEHVPLQLLNENGDPQPLHQIAADGITFPHPVESELVFWGFFSEDKPEPAPGIFMGAGNRVDVLIKCDEPGVYQLIKPRFDQGFLEGPVPNVPNLPEERVPGQEFPLATVICTGRPKRNNRLPSDLRSLTLPTPLEAIPAEDVTGRRVLTFTLDPNSFTDPFPKFMIGGQYRVEDGKVVPEVPSTLKLPPKTPEDFEALFGYLQEDHMVPRQFDPDRVDQVIKEGAVEEWTIVNLFPVDHPFHIHQVPFLVTAINDPRLSPEEQAKIDSTLPRWQDVQVIPGGLITNPDPQNFALTPGILTFRIRFKGGVFTGRTNRVHLEDGKQSIAGQFVLHCHILDHEDTGMMQLIEVVV